MEDYAKMYFKLFNDITNVIRELQNIQKEAEEMFLSQGLESEQITEKCVCMDKLVIMNKDCKS